MRKLIGGEAVSCGMCMMPQFALTPEHLTALRDGSMSDQWFENTADMAWKAARAGYIEQIKRTLRAHAATQLPVVDRRPSQLSLVQARDGGAA